jgi:hypothetical protein
MRNFLFALALLVMSAGCASFGGSQYADDEVQPRELRKLVFVNRGLDRMVIKASDGTSLGRAYVGETRIMDTSRFGMKRIKIYVKVEGAWYATPEFAPADHGGVWCLVVGTNPRMNINQLTPGFCQGIDL